MKIIYPRQKREEVLADQTLEDYLNQKQKPAQGVILTQDELNLLTGFSDHPNIKKLLDRFGLQALINTG